MSALTLNDFFCGCGGMAVGFKNAGFDIVGAWDFDKYAVQSYAANVGDHVRQRDISEMTWDELPTANVWSFGFPCTDISISRRDERLKLDGKRSGLFFEVMRLLDETAENAPERLPKFLVAENVEELGPLLGVLREQYEMRGYTMYAQLFDSRYYDNPQARRRYFVVGVHNSVQSPFRFNTPVYPTRSIAEILDDHVDPAYFYDIDGVKYTYESVERTIVPNELNQIGVLRAKGWLDVMTRVYSVDGIAPTLHTCQGGHRQAKIFDPRYERVRRLTSTEYGRLQAFPMDTWSQVVSNSQSYKQFGNAVTVTVAEAVAFSIRQAIEKSEVQHD